jgi:hypothetical protein
MDTRMMVDDNIKPSEDKIMTDRRWMTATAMIAKDQG